MSVYLDVLGTLLDQADYAEACFGNYTVPEYGETTDGRPVNATGASGSGNSTRRMVKRDAEGSRVGQVLARELGGLSLAMGGGSRL